MAKTSKSKLSSRDKQKAAMRLGDHTREIQRLIEVSERGGLHQTWQLWTDFVEMAAIALSNRVDLRQSAAREAQYLKTAGRYDPEQMDRFCQMLGHLVMALQAGHSDPLGECFMALELGSHWKGQYFTPYTVASAMARMTLGDSWKEHMERDGFFTACEPCIGAGVMVIALHDEVLSAGGNPAENMHVTGIDLCRTATHMAYIQLSLLGIPAVIHNGNSLSGELFSTWYTPLHVIGGWSRKLRLRDQVRLIKGAFHPLEGEEAVPAIEAPSEAEQASEGQLAIAVP